MSHSCSPKPSDRSINLRCNNLHCKMPLMVSQGRLVLGLALISILNLFFYSPLGTNAATHELVEGVCKEAVERATKGNIVTYENCLEALESDSRTRTTSNLKALAKIALELALANATESEAYVDDLLKKNRTSAPLEACSSWYDSAVGSFRSALGELDDDVEVASYDVRIAADDANYCEDALASGGVKVPSISTRNDYIKLYSFIGYVIIDKL